MFKTFFTLILLVLHCIVDIFDFVCDTWVYMKYRIYSSNDNLSVFCDITRHVRILPKVPQHITILLGNENPSYKDLTNIILWSLTAGVSFVSFYDYNGALKKSESLLKSEVEKQQNHEDHIIWHSDHTNTIKNGYKGRNIHVKILSPSDGRRRFAEVCKLLSVDSESKNVDIKCIEGRLRKYYEFPDPELGIYCGKTLSLYDYPPWQVSVTEFLNIVSHHNLPHTYFINILYRYSKCEQRLGK